MYKERVEKLRAILRTRNVDALYVTNFHNMVYITGCKTLSPHEREAYVLVTKDNVYYFTDGRYEIAIKEQLHQLGNGVTFRLISPQSRLFDQISEIISAEQISSLGFEADDLTYSEFHCIKEKLQAIQLTPLADLLPQLRTIKDEEEIAILRHACALTDTCLAEVTQLFTLGMKEQQAAYLFERWIREKGYDVAFDPMVAFDAHAALPHYDSKNGQGILQKCSVILIDFGIRYQNYVSDISRMFFMHSISEEARKVYESLRKVQEQTVQSIGKTAFTFQDIDRVCRAYIDEVGLPQFSHAVGHGVGLEVHEKPIVAQVSTEKILPGHVFTIEPGIYTAGAYGMRVEDTVAIRADGTVEQLTQFPKELAILGV